MKILVSGSFVVGSLDTSYCTAFRKMGCKVIPFDYLLERKSISPLVRNRYANRLFEGFFNSIMNKKLLELVRLNQPDLVLIFKGDFIFPRTLKMIKEEHRGTLLFNFNPDNPFSRNRGASNHLVRGGIPFYDYYFIWGRFLIPELKKAGARRVGYLPFACDPEIHYPAKVDEKEREIYGSDVSFFGTWDREREKLLERLSDYDLGIWGNSWEKLRKGSPLRSKWKRCGDLGKDTSKVCVASKINLNLIREQNGNAHNLRTFVIPACGGFMLTTRTKEQCEFFQENEEIACFETHEELKRQIDQLLHKEDLRKKFSLAANKKVQVHTYDERAKQVLKVYEEIR